MNHAIGFFVYTDRADSNRPVDGICLRNLFTNRRVVEIIHVQGHLHFARGHPFLDAWSSATCDDMDLFDFRIGQRGFQYTVACGAAGAEDRDRLVACCCFFKDRD